VRRVLAFDTATEAVAIGVGEWPEAGEAGSTVLLGELDFVSPRAANSRLLPSVRAVLHTLSLSPADVDAVVVGRGPGSFTGVRIGVATAKGLAHGLGVPLLGVGTPDAIARRFWEHEGLLGVLVDAMRHEVYPTLFSCHDGHVTRLTEDEVATPEDVADRWAAERTGPLLLAGDALARYADVFSEALGSRASFAAEDLWRPSGRGVLVAAFELQDVAGSGDPGAVLPVYTRLADVEEAEAHREGRRPPPPGSGVAGPEGGV
jgi:tRNA threonylcarbamoyl adenosine modification protein YeaZ